MKKLDRITVDKIQFIAAQGAILHPLLDDQYIELIIELDRKEKLCALPITRLQSFYNKIRQKA